MRVMEIPPFPRKIEIRDLGYFVRTRLSQGVVMWPEQAIPLLGHMCHPNDAEARAPLLRMLREWQEGSEAYQSPILRKLGRIQHNWLRVADVLHVFSDLTEGVHQQRRGGPSIGKAITLVEAVAESRGTGEANLWKVWSIYKDVAHLVAAALPISTEAGVIAARESLGPFGLNSDQFGPFIITMLMPDLVIAVALWFERLGLSFVPQALEAPMFDPDTLWRIPSDINVVPIKPPVRKIRPQDLAILNERRAGNRGMGKQSAASIAS